MPLPILEDELVIFNPCIFRGVYIQTRQQLARSPGTLKIELSLPSYELSPFIWRNPANPVNHGFTTTEDLGDYYKWGRVHFEKMDFKWRDLRAKGGLNTVVVVEGDDGYYSIDMLGR